MTRRDDVHESAYAMSVGPQQSEEQAYSPADIILGCAVDSDIESSELVKQWRSWARGQVVMSPRMENESLQEGT